MTAEGADRTEVVTAHISPRDLDRLGRMAERRGLGRDELIALAIDEMLAQEAWSGGFIEPPPQMLVRRRESDR